MVSERVRSAGSPRASWQCPAMVVAVARGLAFFLGGFTIVNRLGALWRPGFDANLWWIDVHALPAWLAGVLLGGAGVLLVAFALYPGMRVLRRVATMAGIGVLLLIAGWNTLQVLRLHMHGQIHLGFPIPFSAFICLALLLVLLPLCFPPAQDRARRALPVLLLTVLACVAGFPVAQLFCFGKTDYRKPADVIVVFGAKAYPDGRPSTALSDRLRTGCALYHAGYAPLLLFSGGPSGGAMHETESMRRYARAHGVPEHAILLDRGGLDTQLTVRNSTTLFRRHGVRRVLAVSHFTHLARIKMTYQRAGWNVATVPVAHAHLPRRQILLQILRETAAFWMYYLRPLWE